MKHKIHGTHTLLFFHDKQAVHTLAGLVQDYFLALMMVGVQIYILQARTPTLRMKLAVLGIRADIEQIKARDFDIKLV